MLTNLNHKDFPLPIWINLKPKKFRITSYNVCYTKLLRWKGPKLAREISRTMDQGLSKVNNWPNDNLFDLDKTIASSHKRPQVIF